MVSWFKATCNLLIDKLFRFFRYFRVTSSYVVWCHGRDLSLIGLIDVDWASNGIKCKSTSGYTLLLEGGEISWYRKKQSYCFIHIGAWMHNLLIDSGRDSLVEEILSVPISYDLRNSCYVSIFILVYIEPKYHRENKHVDICCHYIRAYIYHIHMVANTLSTV